jgi:ABC-type xylose transport system permease subunit
MVLLAGLFAGWLSNIMIASFNWNKVLTAVLAVILGTVLGGIVSFLFAIISIPLAGIR